MKRATIEAKGRVKWFDVTRGFGFIVADGIDGDILVHHSVLKEHGRRSVPTGAELVVEAYQGQRGMQAEKVISIDLTWAEEPEPRRDPMIERSTRCPHGEPGPFETLEVKWFSHTKGYGFLVRGDADVFIHAAIARKGGILGLQGGDVIDARVATSSKGPIVVEVRSATAELEDIAA